MNPSKFPPLDLAAHLILMRHTIRDLEAVPLALERVMARAQELGSLGDLTALQWEKAGGKSVYGLRETVPVGDRADANNLAEEIRGIVLPDIEVPIGRPLAGPAWFTPTTTSSGEAMIDD